MPDCDYLRREFRNHDRRVDIVSAVEVSFTKVDGMVQTVDRFERYPDLCHAHGNRATPDFTVLLTDGTGYVGELAGVSLQDGSIEALVRQMVRYDTLEELPCAPNGAGRTRTFAPVTAIDHLLFVRQADAVSIDYRCRAVLDETRSPYALRHPLVTLGWSFDPDQSKYAFVRNAQNGNPRPRGHGREPSLESWMGAPKQMDSLSGLARHFAPIKIARRLVNDPIPAIYLAVLLWNEIFPRQSGGASEIHVAPRDVAQECRRRWGRGRADDARAALELLALARLAERVEPDRWVVNHRPLTERRDDSSSRFSIASQPDPRGLSPRGTAPSASNSDDSKRNSRWLRSSLIFPDVSPPGLSMGRASCSRRRPGGPQPTFPGGRGRRAGRRLDWRPTGRASIREAGGSRGAGRA